MAGGSWGRGGVVEAAMSRSVPAEGRAGALGAVKIRRRGMPV